MEVKDCEEEMKIAPLNTSTWNDFVSLMKTDSQCSECWCLNHREAVGCATGAAAQDKMRQLTEKNKIGGLLAYKHNECVGWMATDPMSELSEAEKVSVDQAKAQP